VNNAIISDEIGNTPGQKPSYRRTTVNRTAGWQQKGITMVSERIDEIKQPTSRITGLATGFMQLDDLTTGLYPGDLVVVAGRPSMGKSSFARNVAFNVASTTGQPVLFFCLVTSLEHLSQLLLSCESRVDASKLREPSRLDDEDRHRLERASVVLKRVPLRLDCTPRLSARELQTRCRSLHTEHPCSLIIVDGLDALRQCDGPAGDSGTTQADEMSGIWRVLKSIATELAVPVVVVKQMRRAPNSRANKRPILGDLDSDGSEIDIFLFLYRDAFYNRETQDAGIAEIVVAKQQHGPIGTVRLRFDGQCCRFDNLPDPGVPTRA
jgi:replicative DNA helicase